MNREIRSSQTGIMEYVRQLESKIIIMKAEMEETISRRVMRTRIVDFIWGIVAGVGMSYGVWLWIEKSIKRW